MKRSHVYLSLILATLFLPTHAFALGEPLRKVAKDFGKSMRDLKNPRVAILSFPYHDGRISSGSSILSERMTTYMAEIRGVRVVERSLIKKLLEEQHLSETGVVDASAAQRIGKLAGVDVIITGTLNDLETEHTELNARVIKADTGEVLCAERTVVVRRWPDRPRKLNQPVVTTHQPEEEEKPVTNEAIEIGPPAGRGPGRYYGGR